MTGTFKKLGIALALTATTIGAVAPAHADRGRHNGWYQQERGDRYDHDRYDRDGRYDRYDRNGGYDQRYDPRYNQGVRYQYDNRAYGGTRYQSCRSDGAAGTIIGAIAGGLIGNSVAGRHGDKTAGTIIGGAVGAIAGRAIDKSDDRC